MKRKPSKKRADMRFTKFVLRLCKDRNVLERFKKNPDAVTKAAKLTLRQKKALKSKDSDQINKELQKENPLCLVPPGGIRNILCRGVDVDWRMRNRKRRL